MWNKVVDKYLLEVLDSALNKLPPIPRDQPLCTMTDQEVQKWLKSSDFEKSSKQMNYKVSVPQKIAKDRIGARESLVDQLPLSLEDNSTIAGTLNILSDFATLFDLPNSHFLKEYCPFDTTKMKFDIKLARAHFELKLTMHNHQNYMANLNEQLRPTEKIFGDNNDPLVDSIDSDMDTALDDISSLEKQPTNLENEQRKFRLQDKPFWEIFNSLYSDVFHIIESGKEELYLQLISTTRKNNVSKVTDHFQRTSLHVAVELDNLQYARFLVEARCHPNAKEGCGLTPLNLAVIKRNADMCRFLVSSGARYNGPLFTSIPSPHQMAQILDITQIIVIFDEDADMSEDENEVIRSCDETYAKDSKVNKDIACQNKSTDANRSSPGFVTPVVGDVGTCKTNCAANSRSSAFNWVGPVPGDLHNQGLFL